MSQDKEKNTNTSLAFLESVDNGFSAKTKSLSSRYFYDDEGSRIFQQIMNMPEYYLTDAEFEILKNQSADIYSKLDFKVHFNIVELGAGDGKKTTEFLKFLTDGQVNFTYVPIDISQEAINMLELHLHSAIPGIKMNSLVGDYFDMLESLQDQDTPILLLFLGSNLGNFRKDDAVKFMSSLYNNLKKNDKMLLGLDLQKNPHIIRSAYADSEGITRAFNLNLLKRINRELGGNFDLQNWDFYSSYDPVTGDVRSFIISLKEQTVSLKANGKSYSFIENELIYTELSKKYSKYEIEELASATGFNIKKYFLDDKKYFTDVLLEK